MRKIIIALIMIMILLTIIGCDTAKENKKINDIKSNKVESIKIETKDEDIDIENIENIENIESNTDGNVKDIKKEEFVVVDELVYATNAVIVRVAPSIDSNQIGSLNAAESVKRIAKYENNWSKIIYNGQDAYVYSDFLTTEKPKVQENKPVINNENYPIYYSDETSNITIYKEWYENAYCYSVHLQFSDYSRFGTSCANGSYNNGFETVYNASKRIGSLLTVNGCYSAPNLNYPVARNGVVWNNKNCIVPAVYSNDNGLLLSAWEVGGTEGIMGIDLQTLVKEGKVSDTFCFGPPIIDNGILKVSNTDNSRAQRTFIGTNGNPGNIWIIVSDGRKNDGVSDGLTYFQCGKYLQDKGCIFGVMLDGGGSSTLVWKGKTLNAVGNNQRAIVDFVYFK